MSGMDATPLGDLIRRRRQALGLTQQELADAVKVHVSSVISWEAGEHYPKRKLGAIERVLGSLSDKPQPEPDNGGSEDAAAERLRRETARLVDQVRLYTEALERKNRRDDTQARREAAG